MHRYDPVAEELARDVTLHPDAPLVPRPKYRNRDGEFCVSTGCPCCGQRYAHGGFGHRAPDCGGLTDTSDDERTVGYTVAPARLIPALAGVAARARRDRRRISPHGGGFPS